MSWPTVAVSDITNRWRPLTPEEAAIAPTRLDDAEVELQYQLRLRGVLGAPVPTDALWEKIYVRTVADMVRRYLLNPEAWLEETERIDDYGSTKRRDSAVSAGLIYVSDDELSKLLPIEDQPRGAFSIVMGQS